MSGMGGLKQLQPSVYVKFSNLDMGWMMPAVNLLCQSRP